MVNGGGGWGIFNALFGWQNSATNGSVISYNVYWIAIVVGFALLGYNEKAGHWPLVKPMKLSTRNDSETTSDEEGGMVNPPRVVDKNGMHARVSHAIS